LAIAVCAVVSAVVSGGLDRATAGVRALSPWDAQIYASAFEAADKGDFATARSEAEKASDATLLGHLELRRLLSPRHKATYAELTAWLEQYGDLTGAEKIYTLANKRRPEGTPEPKEPAGRTSAHRWELLQAIEDPDADRAAARSRDHGPAAREHYYGGRVEEAYAAAVESGERWIAGLSAYRLNDYPEALRRFDAVARDSDESEWLRAGAAFWAARAAVAAGSPGVAPDYLRMAAAYPTTFYGLIAGRQLGLSLALAAEDPRVQRAVYGRDAEPDLGEFIRENVRARRAAALAQVGLLADAATELRAAMAACETEEDRARWIALAVALDAPMAGLQDGQGRRFVAADYPTPVLAPQGGFTLDPALVYAIVRQESRFNPAARSHAGATGLMQLLPSTAAWFSGDPRLKRPGALRNPATNLRVGQDYFSYLLEKDYVGHDLLRAVAAYNGGSGGLLKALESLGPDADPLMLIESHPFAETRNYVERVMAGYWIYRQMFGADTLSLDALASGARTVDARLDRSTAPGPQRAAVVNVAQDLE
jgi:soluble lytic murein transglycosylase-like protein